MIKPGRFTAFSVLSVLFSLLFFCGGVVSADEMPSLNVFVSILPQADIVRRIGGDRVAVSVLVPPGKSPATYEPTPHQVGNLLQSRVFFTIGVPFESQFLSHLSTMSVTLKIVDVSAGIKKVPISLHSGDRASSGNNDNPDPHVWLSPPLLRIVAQNIARALKEFIPEASADIQNNLVRFEKELSALDADIRSLLSPLKGKRFYVFHPAFGYFGDAYGLQQIALEAGGKSPAPKQIARIIQQARNDDIHTIFIQPEFDSRSALTIANAIHGQLVTLNTLAPDVLSNIRHIAEKIASAFQNKQSGSNSND